MSSAMDGSEEAHTPQSVTRQPRSSAFTNADLRLEPLPQFQFNIVAFRGHPIPRYPYRNSILEPLVHDVFCPRIGRRASIGTATSPPQTGPTCQLPPEGLASGGVSSPRHLVMRAASRILALVLRPVDTALRHFLSRLLCPFHLYLHTAVPLSSHLPWLGRLGQRNVPRTGRGPGYYPRTFRRLLCGRGQG